MLLEWNQQGFIKVRFANLPFFFFFFFFFSYFAIHLLAERYHMGLQILLKVSQIQILLKVSQV